MDGVCLPRRCPLLPAPHSLLSASRFHLPCRPYVSFKEGSRERHQQAVKRAQDRGANVLASYALMGPYHVLVLLDCPDAATAMRAC